MAKWSDLLKKYGTGLSNLVIPMGQLAQAIGSYDGKQTLGAKLGSLAAGWQATNLHSKLYQEALKGGRTGVSKYLAEHKDEYRFMPREYLLDAINKGLAARAGEEEFGRKLKLGEVEHGYRMEEIGKQLAGSENIARMNIESSKDIATLNALMKKYGADLGAESAEKVAKINYDARIQAAKIAADAAKGKLSSTGLSKLLNTNTKYNYELMKIYEKMIAKDPSILNDEEFLSAYNNVRERLGLGLVTKENATGILGTIKGWFTGGDKESSYVVPNLPTVQPQQSVVAPKTSEIPAARLQLTPSHGQSQLPAEIINLPDNGKAVYNGVAYGKKNGILYYFDTATNSWKKLLEVGR